MLDRLSLNYFNELQRRSSCRVSYSFDLPSEFFRRNGIADCVFGVFS